MKLMTKRNQMQRLILLYVISINSVCYAASPDVERMAGRLNGRQGRAQVFEDVKRMGKAGRQQLRAVMKDKTRDREARASAIVFLGRLKATEARKDLEDILDQDDEDSSREASALALGQLGDKASIPKLKKAMNDKYVNVRMRAVESLAKMGDMSGRDSAFKTLTEDADVTGKLLASEALAATGDKTLIPQLQQYTESSDAWTKIYAKLAIKKIEIFDLSGTQRIGYLKSSLADSQFEVTRWAAGELAEIGSPEAIGILKQAAKDRGLNGHYAAEKVLYRLLKEGKITQEELDR